MFHEFYLLKSIVYKQTFVGFSNKNLINIDASNDSFIVLKSFIEEESKTKKLFSHDTIAKQWLYKILLWLMLH
jgi:hypothetical protein|tara:strand:- start:153 stop:371 length:219 start_codon:yes stop_codon:yes gene_type:complete